MKVPFSMGTASSVCRNGAETCRNEVRAPVAIYIVGLVSVQGHAVVEIVGKVCNPVFRFES